MIATKTATEQRLKDKTALNAGIIATGRSLFAAIFLASGPMHFSKHMIDMAASQGVPLASVAVPASGLLAMAGGLSILLGYRAKLGAWAIVLFLLPVTLMMHPFWVAADVAARTLQMTMFMKNLALIGGALLITQFGAGPMSFDARMEA